MGFSLNQNILAIKAIRSLSESTGRLQTSVERLSSGLRINSAADDAAGIAISSSLQLQSRVYSQGSRNASDAISFYAIAEGALQSLNEIVIRLQELAEQASNGSYSYAQRRSLDAEGQALSKEYNRILQGTRFNGARVLNGGEGPLVTQAGFSAVLLDGGNAATGTLATVGTNALLSTPVNVTTADFNGDEIADVAVSGTGSILLGNGDGTFKAVQTVGGVSNWIAAADVNGDGHQDILETYSSAHVFRVYLGNGNGTFKTGQTYAGGSFARALSMADLNGDNYLDVITSSNTGSYLLVSLGNGDGSFRATQSYSTGLNPYSISTGDFNRDGKIDVASVDWTSSRLNIFIGNGDGTLSAPLTYSTGANPTLVIAADLNGDGIADLTTADRGSNQVSVYIGNGDGTFRAAKTYGTGNFPLSVAMDDMNGDGIADLVTGDFTGSRVNILFGNGDGTFRSAQSYASALSQGITIGDFNGDGIPDVVSVESGPSTLRTLLGNAAAQAVAAPAMGFFSLLSRPEALSSLTRFRKLQSSVTASLGTLGASQSRLEIMASTLEASRLNFNQASAMITDVDVAEEAAKLVKERILQQVGAAILAQANLQPTVTLSLLNGPVESAP